MRLNYQLGLSLQQNDQAPLTGLFQRLNRIIPEDQQLQILPSDTPVQQALEQMKRKGFSQIPISDGGEIMGVFSYRSFALGVLRFEDNKTNVLNLTVSDFSEDLPFKNLTDPFEDVIDDLDRRDAVLVGHRHRKTDEYVTNISGDSTARSRRAVLPNWNDRGSNATCTGNSAPNRSCDRVSHNACDGQG